MVSSTSRPYRRRRPGNSPRPLVGPLVAPHGSVDVAERAVPELVTLADLGAQPGLVILGLGSLDQGKGFSQAGKTGAEVTKPLGNPMGVSLAQELVFGGIDLARLAEHGIQLGPDGLGRLADGWGIQSLWGARLVPFPGGKLTSTSSPPGASLPVFGARIIERFGRSDLRVALRSGRGPTRSLGAPYAPIGCGRVVLRVGMRNA